MSGGGRRGFAGGLSSSGRSAIYKFHYTLEESFRDWFEDCDRKELV